jgi:hypothetical protein
VQNYPNHFELKESARSSVTGANSLLCLLNYTVPTKYRDKIRITAVLILLLISITFEQLDTSWKPKIIADDHNDFVTYNSCLEVVAFK